MWRSDWKLERWVRIRIKITKICYQKRYITTKRKGNFKKIEAILKKTYRWKILFWVIGLRYRNQKISLFLRTLIKTLRKSKIRIRNLRFTLYW